MVVSSMISLHCYHGIYFANVFFCFSFAGGFGLLWISCHRSWTCVSGASVKSKTKDPRCSLLELQSLLFLHSAKTYNFISSLLCSGLSGTPPLLLVLNFTLASIGVELHRSRVSDDILRLEDLRVVPA